jgi:hypothetical protein
VPDNFPGKRPFYKYASPDAILAILRNRTVRYSSPLTFNDPFDVQSGLHFDFDLRTLHGKVVDRIHQLAAARAEPEVNQANPWGKIVLQARTHYQTHGFPRDRWLSITACVFDDLVQEMERAQQEYQRRWREEQLPTMRVFCVSEERDNLLMWAHYARNHTGAVLELRSLPDEDNPLSVAGPIEYVDTPPPFFTEQEWIDDLTGMSDLDHNSRYMRYAYLKSNHWAYEREWRVWYPMASHGDYDDMPLRPSELASIYLGCQATPELIQDVRGIVRDAYPSVRLFKASKNERAYTLDYAEV